MRMTGTQIQQVTRGRWLGQAPARVHGICTDTRRIRTGEVFLALRGAHFDGHAFGNLAASRGAAALIGDREGTKGWKDIRLPQLQVKDSLAALGDIAAAWRQRFSGRVVAITGSVGKTSLRSMLEHALPRLDLTVAATRANENNLIGVPTTLLHAQGDEDIVLVECGISEPGEMERLATIVQPDVAVITAISAAHTEGLGGVPGVLREKATLLSTLQPDGWCVLGTGVHRSMLAHGCTPGCALLDMDAPETGCVRWELAGRRLCLQLADQQANIELNLPAAHWGANLALAASIVCRLAGVSLSGAAEALSGWQPVAGRMCCLTGPGGCQIIDDTYNANPASMQAALDTLGRLPGRHFAILGDMAELGTDAARLHAGLEPGELAGLILVGHHMHQLRSRHPAAICVADARAAIGPALAWPLTAGDHVLIKASRRIGLERVVRALTDTSHAV